MENNFRRRGQMSISALPTNITVTGITREASSMTGTISTMHDIKVRSKRMENQYFLGESPLEYEKRVREQEKLDRISKDTLKSVINVQRAVRGHWGRLRYFEALTPEALEEKAMAMLRLHVPRRWLPARLICEYLMQQKLNYFSKMTTSIAIQMCFFLKIATYNAGDLVFNIRDAPVGAYIIFSGRADVMDQDNIALASIPRGNIFGDIGCLRNEPRSATVRISEEEGAVLLSIDKTEFLQFMRNRDQKEMQQRFELIRALPDFVAAKRATIEKLSLLLSKVELRPSKILYRAGDEQPLIYFVAAGTCLEVWPKEYKIDERTMPLHPTQRDVHLATFSPQKKQAELQGRKQRPSAVVSVIYPKQSIGERYLINAHKEKSKPETYDVIAGPAGAVLYCMDREEFKSHLDPGTLMRYKSRIKASQQYRTVREETVSVCVRGETPAPDDKTSDDENEGKAKRSVTGIKGARESIRAPSAIEDYRKQLCPVDPLATAMIFSNEYKLDVEDKSPSPPRSPSRLTRARSTSPEQNHALQSKLVYNLPLVASVPNCREGSLKRPAGKGMYRLLPPAKDADIVLAIANADASELRSTNKLMARMFGTGGLQAPSPLKRPVDDMTPVVMRLPSLRTPSPDFDLTQNSYLNRVLPVHLNLKSGKRLKSPSRKTKKKDTVDLVRELRLGTW